MTPRGTRLTRSARLRLVALLDGSVVGQVYEMGNGRLAFRYDESWRQSPGAYPLTLSMPLAAIEHGHRAIRSYLWGLLPDNPDVLEWWARRYGVSRYDVVELLANVGEDCAGAVQFALPDRVEGLLGLATAADEETSVTWLSEKELEGRLRELRLNPAAGRAASDTGQFSLAGAQPKTAFYQNERGEWGIPRGRMPTNRILKPPTLGLDDLAYNEHLCLLLARELGFPAAVSTVRTFGDEQVIVIERYDRDRLNGILHRVHQEDMCQATGVLPTRKYEVDGGPGIVEIAELLRHQSSEPDIDVLRFVDSIALNWLIAGTDAHAKNYSVLHARGPQLRLAPLYDIITILPYPQLTYGMNKLAMAIGEERLISAIAGSHWRTLADEIGIRGDVLLERVANLAVAIPRAVDRLNATHASDETAHILSRLSQQVVSHCQRCLQRL